MAEDATTTVAGSYKKAISDSKEIRKKTKEMAAKTSKTLLVMVAAATFIWAGYAFFDWAWSGKKTPENVAQPGGQVDMGTIPAPVDKWSKWVNILDNECIYWQGTDPTGNRFKVQYADPKGVVRAYDDTPLTKLRGVRFRSLTGKEEPITYRIIRKQNGAC